MDSKVNAISNNPDHPTITQFADQIHTVCRCCNRQTLDAYLQPTLRPGGHAMIMITCWQLDCGMTGITWDDDSYGDLDLSLYGASQHPTYQGQRR